MIRKFVLPVILLAAATLTGCASPTASDVACRVTITNPTVDAPVQNAREGVLLKGTFDPTCVTAGELRVLERADNGYTYKTADKAPNGTGGNFSLQTGQIGSSGDLPNSSAKFVIVRATQECTEVLNTKSAEVDDAEWRTSDPVLGACPVLAEQLFRYTY